MKMHYPIVRMAFAAVLLIAGAYGAVGQVQTFSDPNTAYTFDFPNDAWKTTTKPFSISSPAEFDRGFRLDGHLQVRSETLKSGESITDRLEQIQEQKLQFLPGYVAGKQEAFAGSLRGFVFNYEFTEAHKPIAGRYYILKADDHTVYTLSFTALRDKLGSIRNETDSIARTFDVKE